MKTVVTLVAVALVVALAPHNAHAGNHHNELAIDEVGHFRIDNNRDYWDDETDFDFDDGSLIVTHRDRHHERSTVEITENYELYVDDELIELDPEQQQLVEEFHSQAGEIIESAKELGWEGAKVGVEGAKLGLKAVACLFKLISSDYDAEDYEAEIEREAERIEDHADRLEDRAGAIEDMVDDFFYIADDMRDHIPQLDELGWF